MITTDAMNEALGERYAGSHVHDDGDTVFQTDMQWSPTGDGWSEDLGTILVSPWDVTVYGDNGGPCDERMWEVVQMAYILTHMDDAPPAPSRCWLERLARTHAR